MGKKAHARRGRRAGAPELRVAARQEALGRFEQAFGRVPPRVEPTAAGAPKLSDALVAFAQPLLDLYGGRLSRRDFEGALSLASAIWNGAIMPQVGREPLVAVVRLALAASGHDVGRAAELAEELRQRRLGSHGDDRRLVTSFAVVEGPGHGEFQVSVTYVLSTGAPRET